MNVEKMVGRLIAQLQSSGTMPEPWNQVLARIGLDPDTLALFTLESPFEATRILGLRLSEYEDQPALKKLFEQQDADNGIECGQVFWSEGAYQEHLIAGQDHIQLEADEMDAADAADLIHAVFRAEGKGREQRATIKGRGSHTIMAGGRILHIKAGRFGRERLSNEVFKGKRPAMLEDVVLRLGCEGTTRAHFLEIQSSRFGYTRARVEIPGQNSDVLNYWLALAAQAFQTPIGIDQFKRRPVPAALLSAGSPSVILGEALGKALFSSSAGSMMGEILKSTDLCPELWVRLVLTLNPRDQGLVIAANLPWELLRWDSGFLLQRDRLAFVRRLGLKQGVKVRRQCSTVNIGVVWCDPVDGSHLDLVSEQRKLCDCLKTKQGIKLHFYRPDTVQDLFQWLEAQSLDILHFAGHGVSQAGRGGLRLRRETVLPRRLAQGLSRQSPWLVVANLCQHLRLGFSGAGGFEPDLATALLESGLSNLLVMQTPIQDDASLCFSSAFYVSLARGLRLDEAVQVARFETALARAGMADWAKPVLFMQDACDSLL